MLPINPLTTKLIGVAAVLALVGWHLLGDWRTSRLLDAARQELATAKATQQRLEDDLVAVTKSRDEHLSKLATAEQTRRKVQQDLSQALTKLKSQTPPSECRAAVEWAVERKDDLRW